MKKSSYIKYIKIFESKQSKIYNHIEAIGYLKQIIFKMKIEEYANRVENIIQESKIFHLCVGSANGDSAKTSTFSVELRRIIVFIGTPSIVFVRRFLPKLLKKGKGNYYAMEKYANDECLHE